MIPVGKRLTHFTPRRITLASLILYCSGFFLSGMSNGSYLMVLLGNGLLVGLGTGLGYLSSITYGIKPFIKKSFPTGTITAAFAIGSVISAKVITLLIDSDLSISSVLIGVSLVQVVLFAIAIFLYPKVPSEKRSEIGQETQHEKSAIKSLPLSLGMFSATFGGLLFISNIQQIVNALQDGINIALAVGLFSVGNASGRILTGVIPLKRYREVTIAVMLSFALLLFLTGDASSVFYIYVTTLLIGLHFGSFFVLFPMSVIKQFGLTQFNKIYPYVFVAYGIAAAVSATLGGTLYDLLGTPKLSLLIASIIEIIGAVILGVTLFKKNR
jgi:MFS transporter, OFA family, oxalate/formate antiporter